MKIFQINVVSNAGSTGRIAESIGKYVVSENGESYIAYGRYANHSESSEVYKVGNKWEIYKHVLISRLFDKQGFGSKNATLELVNKIASIKPDLIHLHVIHGYYLNIKVLFNFLSKLDIPIVWTFHDCWAFTGHCSHFIRINCEKWKSHCSNCELISDYPKSYIDNSNNNFSKKKELFTSVKNLTIVSPSSWLLNEVKYSFFKGFNTVLINNGVNLDKFKPSYSIALKERLNIKDEIVILGVSSIWDKRKGFQDFINLAQILDEKYKIIMVGLSNAQIKNLPSNIIGIQKTDSVDELAEYYTLADVFFNPTYEDTFPTVNIEALACGTPIITYNNVGGSPEIVDKSTGRVVEKGNINLVVEKINEIGRKQENSFSYFCRKRAEVYYDEKINFQKYIQLYKKLI